MGNRIEDIARLAGVSTATVSRAINSPEKVSPATRQKVESVISAHGYTPNYFARGLMKHRTDSVGVLTSYHTNPYYTEIIDTIVRAFTQNGTYLYLCNCEHDIELERKYTEELLRRNIDALIVVETPSLNTSENNFLYRQFDCPVILINQHLEPYGDAYIIRCDQEPGIQEVFAYVQQHRLFPFVLFFGVDNSYSFRLKEELFRKWKDQSGLSDRDVRLYRSEKLVDTNDENTVWYTSEILKELFAAPSRPRSIFTGNELMAMGALTAARELSIPVPQELAVIGIDNTILSRISSPPLSTVDLRMRDIGNMAVELYLDIKNNGEKVHAKVQSIPSRLCFRKSL
ncbi:ribose operon repressor [Spirochaetia bacterium]|nr:ribose operon repressor [Spirochaetia bacterium]